MLGEVARAVFPPNTFAVPC